MQKKFEINPNEFENKNFPEILEFIRDSLAELKVEKRKITHTELMCEETLVNLFQHSDFSKKNFILVNVKKFLGDVSVELKVPGNEFDFIFNNGVSLIDEDEDDDTTEIIRNLLLRSFAANLRYKHKGIFNTVRINVLRSQASSIYRVLTALTLAIVTGLLMRNFLSEDLIATLNEDFFVLVRTLFLNGLKMCAVPVVFLSIVSCFSQSGNLSGMKRVGIKLVSYSLFHLIIATAVGIGIVYFFGIGKGANLIAASAADTASQTVSISFKDTALGFMPDNFIRPFYEGNMIQLMVLAILTGVAINLSGVKIIASVLDELNRIFMKITEIILHLMPLLVYCSMASIFLTTGTKTLMLLLEILFGIMGANVLIHMTYCLMILFIARLNPVHMFKKAASAMITAFTTTSSISTIPESMKASNNMGISSSVYSFTIPLGTILCKNSFCMYLALNTLAITNMYGVEVNAAKLFSIAFSTVVFAVAMPPLPGMGIIALSLFLASVDCPLDGIAISLGIDPIADMLDTILLVMAVITSTLIIAKTEKQLDIEKYQES
ncbi:MAG: dicarboxylate/amino acid:cation symporter [Synergistaceae bacterium]|nr:dicarboxylate/amino acid:cation symporter [Synergistaceae bacterium]